MWCVLLLWMKRFDPQKHESVCFRSYHEPHYHHYDDHYFPHHYHHHHPHHYFSHGYEIVAHWVIILPGIKNQNSERLPNLSSSNFLSGLQVFKFSSPNQTKGVIKVNILASQLVYCCLRCENRCTNTRLPSFFFLLLVSGASKRFLSCCLRRNTCSTQRMKAENFYPAMESLLCR